MTETEHTLAVDIGGTMIKCQTVGIFGEPTGAHKTWPTPRPATPARVMDGIIDNAKTARFDRVSIGFPGVVHVCEGVTASAPNLDGNWRGFPLARELYGQLGRPVRVAKDADLHGFGAVSGRGVELLLTLGTGVGSALFIDGHLVPNVDLAHHVMRMNRTYEQLLGKHALQNIGMKTWQSNLRWAVSQLEAVFHCDLLYLGGGYAVLAERLGLPGNVRLVSNTVALRGAVALWDSDRIPASWASAFQDDPSVFRQDLN